MVTALLVAGFLFESNPFVFVLGNQCEIIEQKSAPVVKIVPSAGTIIFYYAPNSSEAIVADKHVHEIHVLEKGKTHFFEYRNRIIYKTKEPICESF